MIGRVRGAALAAGVAVLVSACQVSGPQPERAEDSVKAVLRDAASSSREMHNYRAALTYYRTLFRRDPGDVKALLGYARGLRLTGAAKEAVVVLRRGVERLPGAPELLTELGKAQLASGRPQEALSALRLAEARGERGWRLYSARGIANDMLGDFDAAQADYRKALEIEPDRASVLNNLALSRALSGRLDGAIALLEELAASPTATAQTRQNLALLYALKGDAERAAELARRDLSAAEAARNAAVYRQLATAGGAAARD